MTRSKPIELRYQRAQVMGDAARSVLGLVATLGPILFLDPLPWLVWVLAVAALLFAAMGMKAVESACTAIILEGSMIHRRSLISRSVDIEKLDRIKLSYFGRRNGEGKGWMSLTIGSEDQKVSVDSNLERFDELAGATLNAARRNKIFLDPTSAHNFSMLGHSVEDE